MADVMRLESLELRDFRCFEAAEIEFDPRLTLLVADNGGGKTATLDAVSIALTQLIPATRTRRTKAQPRERGLDLEPSDARSVEAMPPYGHSAFPVSIGCAATLRGEVVSWSTTLAGVDSEVEVSLPPSARRLASNAEIQTTPALPLPVVAHYGTSRTSGGVHARRVPTLGRIPRQLGYRNALRSAANYSELTEWLAQTEWERTSSRGSPWEPLLGCIYEAASQVLAPHGVSAVYYSLEERDLVVEFRHSAERRTVLPMSVLADGYRSVLALVADLAFRCGALNAEYGAEAAQLTEGVVLVDEIDMHLHPKWQARIVPDLLLTFPRIQFVLTTHSPLVVSSVENSSIRDISSDDGVSSFSDVHRKTLGADVDYITTAVMEGPTRADTPFSAALIRLSDAMAHDDMNRAAEAAEEVRLLLGEGDDFDAKRLLLEFDWRQARGKPRSTDATN